MFISSNSHSVESMRSIDFAAAMQKAESSIIQTTG